MFPVPVHICMSPAFIPHSVSVVKHRRADSSVLCEREKKGYMDGEIKGGGREEKRDRAVIVCSLVALSPHSMSGTFLSVSLSVCVSLSVHLPPSLTHSFHIPPSFLL